MEIVEILDRRFVGKNGNKLRYAKCKCPLCGNIVERTKIQCIQGKSCGCKGKGHASKKHGMSKTRQYKIWEDMKKRCDNKNSKCYHRYGERGITYDPKWKTFEGFWKDMEDGYSDNLTIDRIDNNGDYTKKNCQWINQQENAGKDHRGIKFSKEHRDKISKALTGKVRTKEHSKNISEALKRKHREQCNKTA